MRPLRVLTLNIWNRSGPWDERLAVIRAGLRALDPDLIALQEVLSPEGLPMPGQHEQIGEGLGYHAAFGASASLGGIAYGNALLSRWPVARSEVLPLGASTKAGDFGCSLLASEIDAPFGVIPFFVTHLVWRLHEGAIRRKQVVALAEHVARLAPVARAEAFPAIVAGDFNAEPDSDEIRYLRGLATIDGGSVYFADCHAVAGEGPGVTFSKRNAYAAESREPERRIDYVFVRGPDRRGRGQPLSAEVCLDRPHDGVFASDHFGVLATIRVDEDPR
jgi:endonuclease/exonuclease/phosphatase family metal-dependent hydrolase